ncbi:hypothetical protein D1872_280960 [compost metagenome]
MHRIAGLKADNPFPPLLRKDAPGFRRVEIELAEPFGLRAVQYRHLSAYINRGAFKQFFYTRVFQIVRFKHIHRFFTLIHFIDAAYF